MVPRFALLHAPSILGLRPTGVERLPEALEAAGLRSGLGAEFAGRIEPPPYDPRRDPKTGILNPTGLVGFSRRLADAVTRELRRGAFPIVLGGDCSNLIGCALALRGMGRYGLLFLDGHADFYHPEAEPNGEVASMDLAIVSGHGPAVLADLDGLRPLVREEDIVAFGYRDEEEQQKHGSQDIGETAIHCFPLHEVRRTSAADAAERAAAILHERDVEGIWIHLDADVLDDRVMPAVDYRLPGGLSWEELSATLRAVMATGRAVGLNVGIFNPSLDPDGSIARRLVSCIVEGVSQ
uniref:Putative Arginase n=1 Tax=uncultured bacterium lac160 TaxID=1447241 RepID=X2LBP2_9BACT|nr:putative Arginase [uncultured bacterium lac160]